MVRMVARNRGPVSALSTERRDEMLAASTDRPHEGRAYDYYLGGLSNWAADREFAREQIQLVPDLPWAARQNRRCLGRMVRYMLSQGIRQFVDVGSGLPTEGNVHQICERDAPGETNVVYVDHDPIATSHAHLLLEQAGYLDRHVPITAELRDTSEMWQAVIDTGAIDRDQPVGLLLMAVLHFVVDDQEAHSAVQQLRDVLPVGSHFGLSHASADDRSLDSVMKNYDKATSSARTRTPAEILEFFGDWDVMAPGVVWTCEWTAGGNDLDDQVAGELDPTRSKIRAGLARKLP